MSLSVAVLLFLQVAVVSLAQKADAQFIPFPDQTLATSGFMVDIEYRWINFYHTLAPDPYFRSDHSISFKSNATVLHTFLNDFEGNGTGHYREEILDDRNFETDSYYYLLEGEALMEVLVRGDISEVQVSILGKNLTRIERDTSFGQNISIQDQNGEVDEGCSFDSVDLEAGGSYKSTGYVDYTDEDDRMEQGCLMTITPLGQQIDVKVDDPELFLKYNIDQTNVQSTPTTKVTVTLSAGGIPLKNKAVAIKVCTLPGTVTTDGHIGHDARAAGWQKSWFELCDQGHRPFGQLRASSGLKGALLVERTDNNGKIVLDYFPPKHKKYQYIAGTDEITATAMYSPRLQDKATVITKVADLVQMPGSPNCIGTADYNFGPQSGSKHGCIFYGTAAANRALQDIGDEFMQRQADCANNSTSGACLVSYGGSSYYVNITGSPVPMRINAMSLPWGGLTDNVGGVPWSPPHASHNDGRQVDLSFGIYNKKGIAKDNPLCSGSGPKCANYDIDRIMLLRDVIENSSNFHRFPSYEGGDLAATFRDKAPHIHIFFKS